MAQNTAPIFVGVPHSSWVQTSSSAVTSTDGTDANVKSAFTAGTNGSRIENVYILAAATFGTSAMTVRFWVNNGSTPSTATNNTLIHEETMPQATVGTTAASSSIIWNAQLLLPAGYKLLVGGAVASQAVNVSCVGGDY